MTAGANKETDLALVGEAVDWIRRSPCYHKPDRRYASEIEKLSREVETLRARAVRAKKDHAIASAALETISRVPIDNAPLHGTHLGRAIEIAREANGKIACP